jgi:RNA polymerase sigma factor (sigma-70 family)
MAHDRDAEDRRLLGTGDHPALLAAYYPVVRQRVRLRVPDPDADDVVQRVMVRLLAELTRGRVYAVPYRVVVHQVVTRTIKEHFGERPAEVARLDEHDRPVDDEAFGAVEDRLVLERLLADLPPRQREVLSDRFLEGLEIVDIAARRRMTRNAVDQALFAGRRALRKKLCLA